jgi:hypothetical protein
MLKPIRVLLGWQEQDEAIKALLGAIPKPDQDVAAQIAEWKSKKAAVLARPPYSPPTGAYKPLPAHLATQGAAFLQRADVQATLRGLHYELGVVALDDVIAFQKTVSLEQPQERDEPVSQDDWGQLFARCLPGPGSSEQIGSVLADDGKSLTISSLNPNLRVSQLGLRDPTAGDQLQFGQKVRFIGFGVAFVTSFVQVAEYNGRLFLKDGYHCCYRLLSRGVNRVPCVYIRAKNLTEVGAVQSDCFKYDVLSGPRPPRLKDFHDDSVSVTTQARALRKVIRIAAEEFFIEI